MSFGFYLNPGMRPGERFDFGIVGSIGGGVGLDASAGVTVSALVGDASKLNGVTDFAEAGVWWPTGRYSRGGYRDCCMPEVQIVEGGLEYSPLAGSAAVGKEATGKLGYADVVDAVNWGARKFNEFPKWTQQKVLQYLNERFKGGVAEAERMRTQERKCNRNLGKYCPD